MPLQPPNIVITGLNCCGWALRNMGGGAIEEAYISEDSSHNPYDPTYKIFINEENDEIYFVPETFNPDVMAEPMKFSEVTTAPDITEMSFFVGITGDEEDGYVNYRFTPAQLIAYIGEQMPSSIAYTKVGDGGSFTDSSISGRTVRAILTDRAAYQRTEDFTQSGDTITGVSISYYDGQKMTLLF